MEVNKTVTAYPQEYLEEWDIRTEMVKTREEVDQLKREWKEDGYTCSRKKYDFGFDVGYNVVGLIDKTNTRTRKEIKKELRSLV